MLISAILVPQNWPNEGMETEQKTVKIVGGYAARINFDKKLSC